MAIAAIAAIAEPSETQPAISGGEQKLGEVFARLVSSDTFKLKGGDLPSPDECRALLAALDADSAPCGLETATKAAERILGGHSRADAHDPDIYVATIALIMSDFPAGVVDRASDPRVGVVRKIKWLPKPFEIGEFCDNEMSRRRTARYFANRIIETGSLPVHNSEIRIPPPDSTKAKTVSKLIAKAVKSV